MLINRSTLKSEMLFNDALIIDQMNKSDIVQTKSEIKKASRSPLTSSHDPSSAKISISQSSYASTNYQRYISWVYVKDNSQDEDNDDNNRKQYWSMVTRSVLYLKREMLNESIHDQLLLQAYKRHFDFSKLDPTPITEVGKSLLSCGYFLAAYAMLLARLRQKGKALIEYFKVAFQKHRIIYGSKELKWYLSEDYPCTAHIFGLSIQNNKMNRQSPIARVSTSDSIPFDHLNPDKSP